MLFLLVTSACTPPEAPPRPDPSAPASREPIGDEVDLSWAERGELHVGSATVLVEGTTLLTNAGVPFATGLYEAPAFDADTLCAVGDGAGGNESLRCWPVEAGGIGQPTTIVSGGRPDRVALAGSAVAWVASPSGLPQVFVGDARGASPPRALTNVGLTRANGTPPPGFVPPPHRDSLHFHGAYLRWHAPDGEREVLWR